MGLFSGKKEKKKEGEDNSDYGKIPKVLPDTLMQKLSSSKQPSTIIPRKIYTEDIKSNLQAKPLIDEHRRIPESFVSQVQKEKSPAHHDIEKVVMIKKELDDAATELRSSDLPSFFAELERRIFSKGLDRKHLVSQDMMLKLKDYHDSLSKGTPFFLHELEIEQEIAKSLSELRDIETEWLMTKRNVSLAEKVLYEKESELEKKLSIFRNLLSSSEKFRAFNMVADNDKAFFLIDGTRISSIHELLHALPTMKEEVFSFHVTSEKNDFATWILHVFSLDELSSKVAFAKNKNELLEVLRNY